MSDVVLAWSYAHWTPQQEKAYQVYRGLAKRSLRKTAELAEVPVGTVMAWSRELGWVFRVRDDDLQDGMIMRDHANRAIHNSFDAVIDRAVTIALHSADERVALEAIKFLYQAGVESGAQQQDGDERKRYSLDDLRKMSTEQKRAIQAGRPPTDQSS